MPKTHHASLIEYTGQISGLSRKDFYRIGETVVACRVGNSEGDGVGSRGRVLVRRVLVRATTPVAKIPVVGQAGSARIVGKHGRLAQIIRTG